MSSFQELVLFSVQSKQKSAPISQQRNKQVAFDECAYVWKESFTFVTLQPTREISVKVLLTTVNV